MAVERRPPESEPARPAGPARPAFRAPRKSPWSKIAVAIATIAVVAAVVGRRYRPKPVTVVAVGRGSAVEAVYATGTVEALDRVVVKAKTSGSIAELKAREGDRVQKGDLLAVVDSPALRFELTKGRADLWAATNQAGTKGPQLEALDAQARATRALLENAKAERDRLAKLVAAGTATQVDLDKATTQVANLEAQLAAQQAQRRALQIDLGARATGAGAAVDALSARLADTEVRAPLAGVVLFRAVEPGEVVAINQPLFRVGDVTNLILECLVDEADVGRVREGASVAISLYAFPGEAFRGQVFAIFPDADRAKKSFLVKVRFERPPPGLRSGMSAEVNVIIDERAGALLAPAEAIEGDATAWVVREGRVERRTLKLGVRDMVRVEVLSGVGEGERLVVAGFDGLSEGARVTPTEKTLDLANKAPPRPKAGL
jgi:multidrug efflux pump subunit AcrA (membrane-fusion protein)